MNFTATPSHGNAPLSVQFNDTSTGTGITGYRWIFSDNPGVVINTTRNAGHTFTVPGLYSVNHSVIAGGIPFWKNVSGYIQVLAPRPVVTSFSPSKHRHDNRAFTATIKGSGFQPGTQGTNISLTNPLYPSISGTGVKVVSAGKITCMIRISKKTKPGVRNVTVTNPDGQVAILVNKFKVTT